MIKKTLLSFVFFLCIHSLSYAGNGFYYGADIISQKLDTKTKTRLVFLSPARPPSTRNAERSQSFSDASVYAGYIYKRRRTQSFFLAPEFFLSTLDSDDYIYGTVLKIGYDWRRMRFFGNIGVSRVDVFKQNKLHAGAGIEYAFSKRTSFSLGWQRFDTIEENTTTLTRFGGQTLITTTNTTRDIDAINLGIRFYLHE